jgi:hypothetical protein
MVKTSQSDFSVTHCEVAVVSNEKPRWGHIECHCERIVPNHCEMIVPHHSDFILLFYYEIILFFHYEIILFFHYEIKNFIVNPHPPPNYIFKNNLN